MEIGGYEESIIRIVMALEDSEHVDAINCFKGQ
jgi:hypothetical protein